MIAQLNSPFLTPEQYLAAEAQSTLKHEYINGEVVAMAGASQNHGLIVTNLVALLRPQLRVSGCRLFSSDMKVNVSRRNCFYYPDLVVSCDDRDRAAAQPYLQYPTLIIEVLSDSTESFDRGEKFLDYGTIPSLQEYCLISQKHQRVEQFHRQNAQQWLLTHHSSDAELMFQSLGCKVAIADIYEDVVF